MKLKNGFKLKKYEDFYTVLDSQDNEIKSFHLTEFGAFIWDVLSKENLSNSELLNRLLNNFEISTVLALGEIDTFIKKCKENGIFE